MKQFVNKSKVLLILKKSIVIKNDFKIYSDKYVEAYSLYYLTTKYYWGQYRQLFFETTEQNQTCTTLTKTFN